MKFERISEKEYVAQAWRGNIALAVYDNGDGTYQISAQPTITHFQDWFMEDLHEGDLKTAKTACAELAYDLIDHISDEFERQRS